MVSLINFKIVNEELRGEQQQQQQQHQIINTNESASYPLATQTNSGQMYIKIVKQHEDSPAAQHVDQVTNRTINSNQADYNETTITNTSTLQANRTIDGSNNNSNKSQNLQLVSNRQQQQMKSNQSLKKPKILFNSHHQAFCSDSTPPPPVADQHLSLVQPVAQEAPNFVVTWRNLRFMIEPKWHQKVVSPVLSSNNRTTSESNGSNLNRAVVPAIGSVQQSSNSCQAAQSKVVLDKLDGSFRSGELTAILGPSGAGKTTLLDCLTGHRKHGLSGSIKISSSSTSPSSILNKCHFNNNNNSNGNSNIINNHLNANHRQHNSSSSTTTTTTSSLVSAYGKQNEQITQTNNGRHLFNSNNNNNNQSSPANGGDNLKVSIIPQNDHLMGHLTVYETLNYASKMKNCFDKQFDHKLNIKRVAQQLGLMSCLGTRINKLSGGQYKRVSIAQELLSSPDILILDEPTSGLDAMTCYQTVQVLRKLTDDRRESGQNQIAVILTIHQPNSDVFQQFNHVYVVAQGGKCIYEGPPASIESVINRVGIRLPNSYYNPATMIVEIAAGKFGLDAIQKLNSIQKKQYEFVLLDEQNSTGDSAVDCPSSSSSNDDDDDDDDDDDVDNDNNVDHGDNLAAAIARRHVEDDNNNCRISEINNNIGGNNSATSPPPSSGGLVNKGFVMETNETNMLTNGNSNNNNNGLTQQQQRDVIVEVPKLGLNCTPGNREDADSVDKIKMVNNNNNNNNNNIGGVEQQLHSVTADSMEGRQRKKRRRTRKRSGDQQSSNNSSILTDISSQDTSTTTVVCATAKFAASGCGKGGGGNPGGGGGGGNGASSTPASARGEKRLKLNSLKADQKFPFWRHTYLHFHRSWLSIVRDPMLCSMQLALHIIVPVMVSLVYGTTVGKPNACPRAGPMDIMAYALEPTDSALQLQEDLRTTLENIGYIFFKLYGIIFAAMTVTVLTFPLDMHVLVKEFRNGWYGLSSYFLGRTLADIPFQLTLPLLAMSLSYYATGQPYSYMQWRFLSITAILILSSLIAQSQGLLFGAILMDKMKAAVFVAPAATTPIILFAGFLVRTQSIPRYLRPLSNLSYLRYAIEACLISRYGFNQCECDPAMFNQTVPELPPIARSMLDYWLSSFKASTGDNGHDTLASSNSSNSELLPETTTFASTSGNPDLFTKLIDSLAKANSFGRNITSCEQVVPYPMIDYDLKDSQLFNCFAILIFMLLFTRLLTFFIVCFKVKRKV